MSKINFTKCEGCGKIFQLWAVSVEVGFFKKETEYHWAEEPDVANLVCDRCGNTIEKGGTSRDTLFCKVCDRHMTAHIECPKCGRRGRGKSLGMFDSVPMVSKGCPAPLPPKKKPPQPAQAAPAKAAPAPAKTGGNKFCENCGKKADNPGAKFCGGCGNPL